MNYLKCPKCKKDEWTEEYSNVVTGEMHVICNNCKNKVTLEVNGKMFQILKLIHNDM